MIFEVVEIFKSALSTLSFKDVLAGVVKPVKLRVADVEKTVPVEYNPTKTACQASDYYDLVPNNTKKSIIYFEDKGTRITEINAAYIVYETSIRLVCWFNYKLINPVYYNDFPFVNEVVSLIPDGVGNYVELNRVFVHFEGQPEKLPDIFSDYTYNEAEKQYLTYPYDYFALDYNVSYSVSKQCIDPVVLNPSEC